MDFLVANSNGEPVMILIIIAIVVIAAGIVVYYFLSSTNTKNKKPTINKPVNFEVANDLSDNNIEEIPNKFQEEFMEDVLEESLPEIETEEEKTSNNIASLLEQMQQDLDDSETAKVEKYEEEQEENAIISYKELMRLKAERENNAEVAVKHNDEIIPTHVEAIKQVEEVKEEPKNDEIKKFKKSEFISPVFGLNDSNVTYREIRRPERKERNDEYSSREDEVEVVNLEKDNNIKSVEDERNDDFLEALVDFRNKLN